MRPDEPFQSVEPAVEQLDWAIAELRRLARDVDGTGQPNSASIQKSAVRGLFSTQAELQAAVPDSLKTMVEAAYQEPNQDDSTVADARQDARQWLITNKILLQQELMTPTHS